MGTSTAFRPDIIVTGDDGFRLVVEAKLRLPDLDESEQQLKQYMRRMHCPTGLLVTPKHMWVYRDFYTTESPESIERIGDFDMTGVWQQTPPADAASFEDFVQQWLERNAQQLPPNLPSGIGQVLREDILAAVAGGQIRAAHPR